MALAIYAQLVPILAVGFTLASFYSPKNMMPSLMAALFWFVSSVTATHITFISCCNQSPYYTIDGTSDFVYFFGFLSLIMVVHTILIILRISTDAMKESKL